MGKKATVITNLLSTVPYIGKILVEYIWGGFNVGGPTLNRFYSIHYLLPFVIAGVTITHLIALHDSGATNPLGISSNKALINFNPYFTYKDILGFVLIITLLLIMVYYSPNTLGQRVAVISSNRYYNNNTICWKDLILNTPS